MSQITDENDLLSCPRCGCRVTLGAQEREIDSLKKKKEQLEWERQNPGKERMHFGHYDIPQPGEVHLYLAVCVQCGNVYDNEARKKAKENAARIEKLREEIEGPLKSLARAVVEDPLTDV